MWAKRFRKSAARRSFALALVGWVLLWVVAPAHGVPVFGDRFSLKQPDGTAVEVRIWGDEYYQVVESLDGYTLVRDPQSGVICYATLTAEGDLASTGVPANAPPAAKSGLAPHLRPSAKLVALRVQEARLRIQGPAKARRAAPTTGAVEGLCLLVDFSDVPQTIPRADIESFCNLPGYTGYGNNGSVRDYFHDVSNGNLTYTNVLPANIGPNGYYRATYPKSHYDDPGEPAGPGAVELITEALNALQAQGFDFSAYDKDGDGAVDAVNCFYAGTTSSGWAMGLWPHQGGIHWTSGSGVAVTAYQISDLDTGPTLATFCHENGHLVCDWPDLYDYDIGEDDSRGVGLFCLMCAYGSQTNPVEPCAPLKELAGWGSVTALSTPQTGLGLAAGANAFYKLVNPDAPTEYFLLENRQAAGRDAALPASGLALWHVDTQGSNDWQQQTPALHYFATLVQADGRWDLEGNVNSGDSSDLWGAPVYTHCGLNTSPNTNWWSGMPSELDISNVSASGPAMTFDFAPPRLKMTPYAALESQGPQGGPFAPVSAAFTLQNTGAASVGWTASPGQAWIAVSPAGGTLAPGATASVQVSYAAAAGALAPGVYESGVTVTNTGSGEAQVRPVRLQVGTVDFFTEHFQNDDGDLAFSTLTLTPDGSGGRYSACRATAVAFPTDPAGGTPLYLSDDDAIRVALSGGQQVQLYGQAYGAFYVGSNGYLTFGGGDTSWEVSLDRHFRWPRVAALFEDLSPNLGGGVSWKQLADRAAVTYSGVPRYGTASSNSFQIELFFNGILRLTWLRLDDRGGITGLSEGKGEPFAFAETDLSAYGVCGAPLVSASMTSTAADPTRFSPIPVRVVFGEAVTGFSAADVAPTNASVTGFAAVSGNTYTFNLVPSGQGAVGASIAEGAATGVSGGATASAFIGRLYDSVPPSVAVGPPSASLTAAGPVDYPVTYTDAASVSLVPAHVALSRTGTAAGVVEILGDGVSSRVVRISNVTGSGTLAVSIAGGTAVDAAGNPAAAAGPGAAFTADNTPPMLQIVGTTLYPVEQFSVYEEPGAVAVDNNDGDLSGAVSIDASAVDTARLGHYTVVYTVADGAGNVSRRYRTVVVTPVGQANLPVAGWPAAAALVATGWLALRRRPRA